MNLRDCFLVTALAAACFSCTPVWAQNIAVEVVVDEVAEVEVVAGEAEDVQEIEAELEEVEFADMAMAMNPGDRNLVKMQTIAKVQCAMVRRVCDLKPDQEKKLDEVNDDWVKKASRQKQVMVAQQRQPGLIAQFFGARPAQVRARPQKVDIQKHLDEHFDSFLTDEQKESYEEHKESAAKFRAESTASALVETLQHRLALTDEQRKEIEEKIFDWVSKQDLRVEIYFSNNNYYPEIPQQYLKCLNKDQLRIYRGLQRYLFTDENFHDGQLPIVIKQ